METKLHYLLPCCRNEEKTCLNELLSYTVSILIEPSGGQLTYMGFSSANITSNLEPPGETKILWCKCSQAPTQHQRKRTEWYKGSWLPFFDSKPFYGVLLLMIIVTVGGGGNLITSQNLAWSSFTSHYCFHLVCLRVRVELLPGRALFTKWPFLTKLWLPTLQADLSYPESWTPCRSRKRDPPLFCPI